MDRIDRRRNAGPAGPTKPPVFAEDGMGRPGRKDARPHRTRPANALRKMFLRTGVTPSASGSAYLECGSSPASGPHTIPFPKLTCTVHGPRPLPKNAPFSPHIALTATVKYAPFATRQRRGYIRDNTERDLSVHLETALRGVVIGDRWPKSAVEIVITVLEGEEDAWAGDHDADSSKHDWGTMSVLSGCITVAAAAIADAGIDCVDLVAGGIAALVRDPAGGEGTATSLVLDPVPCEHDVLAACVIAYLPSRDEITDLWMKGDATMTMTDGSPSDSAQVIERLTDHAVQAAMGAQKVLLIALQETADLKLKK